MMKMEKMANYYQEFIEDLDKLRQPLYEVKEEETLKQTKEIVAAKSTFD
jgi:hypothetical protein